MEIQVLPMKATILATVSPKNKFEVIMLSLVFKDS